MPIREKRETVLLSQELEGFDDQFNYQSRSMKKRKRLDSEQSKKLDFEKRLFQLKLNAGVFDHKKTEQGESPSCVGKRLRMARSPMPLAVDNLEAPAAKVPTLNIVLSQ